MDKLKMMFGNMFYGTQLICDLTYQDNFIASMTAEAHYVSSEITAGGASHLSFKTQLSGMINCSIRVGTRHNT